LLKRASLLKFKDGLFSDEIQDDEIQDDRTLWKPLEKRM
jgi:hypothetical protein